MKVKKLRIALISDIHYGRDDATKQGSNAKRILHSVLEDIQQQTFDLLIDLGDRISDENPDLDYQRTAELAEIFAQSDVSRIHMLGNHDIGHLSVTQQEALLHTNMRSRSMLINGWQCIFWYSDSTYHGGNLIIPAEDLQWLAREIESAVYPSIVVTHVPVHNGSMAGNYYFEDSPEGRAYHYNVEQARNIITSSSSVVLVVSGHCHWNSLATIDGIHFVTIQSLIEGFNTRNEPAESWGTLELSSDCVRLKVHGKDPIYYELPVRDKGFHSLKRPKKNPPRLTPASGGEIPSPIEGILLDLDGVVYSGSQTLPGAREFLGHVRSRGIRLIAVTNHSGRHSSDVVNKLQLLGLAVSEDEIITSGYATASYLARQESTSRVFVLGEKALETELRQAGMSVIEDVSPVADYVVVGYYQDFSRRRIEMAVNHLLSGAKLIGTNPDKLLPTPGGLIPECGPLISFLEQSASVEAVVIGKPNKEIIQQALVKLGIPKHRTIIVGDNPETDIEAGRRAGIASVWIWGNSELSNTSHALREGEDIHNFRDLTELNHTLFSDK